MSEENLNPYAAPVASLVPETESGPFADGVWREANLLVVRKGSLLPDRCVKCNEPMAGRRKRQTHYWHSPWLYILIISPIIFIIVSMIVRQSVVLQTGVCRRHRAQRNRILLVAWLLFFGGIGAIIYGACLLDDRQTQDFGWPTILAGCGLIIGGAIYGVICSRLLWPKRIDPYFAWMNGASSVYLAELPELPPPPPPIPPYRSR
ncbi:MAG TPA: hypothetical protein VHX65_11725 [Pirellulales bacterium]|jgi:hypothetical protein|nr:hypothetical protein [Pirellulales bacterium]